MKIISNTTSPELEVPDRKNKTSKQAYYNLDKYKFRFSTSTVTNETQPNTASVVGEDSLLSKRGHRIFFKNSCQESFSSEFSPQSLLNRRNMRISETTTSKNYCLLELNNFLSLAYAGVTRIMKVLNLQGTSMLHKCLLVLLNSFQKAKGPFRKMVMKVLELLGRMAKSHKWKTLAFCLVRLAASCMKFSLFLMKIILLTEMKVLSFLFKFFYLQLQKQYPSFVNKLEMGYFRMTAFLNVCLTKKLSSINNYECQIANKLVKITVSELLIQESVQSLSVSTTDVSSNSTFLQDSSHINEIDSESIQFSESDVNDNEDNKSDMTEISSQSGLEHNWQNLSTFNYQQTQSRDDSMSYNKSPLPTTADTSLSDKENSHLSGSSMQNCKLKNYKGSKTPSSSVRCQNFISINSNRKGKGRNLLLEEAST